jgi:hypothetical protein
MVPKFIDERRLVRSYQEIFQKIIKDKIANKLELIDQKFGIVTINHFDLIK